jgi:hypothetical protein
MIIFVSIAIAAFLIVAGGFLFGHDADGGIDHDIDHDMDAEGGDDVHGIIGIVAGMVLAALMYGGMMLFIEQQARVFEGEGQAAKTKAIMLAESGGDPVENRPISTNESRPSVHLLAACSEFGLQSAGHA